MTPDLLQGKRKREEEEEDEVVEPEPEEEKKVLSEPTRENDEEPEPDLKPENLRDFAGQPEQDQPLRLVKKTNTQHIAETGKMLNLVFSIQ